MVVVSLLQSIVPFDDSIFNRQIVMTMDEGNGGGGGGLSNSGVTRDTSAQLMVPFNWDDGFDALWDLLGL